MSFQDPLINQLPAPLLLEGAIQSVQNTLSTDLVWLDRMFGRAWECKRQEETSGAIQRLTDVFIYPGAYQENGEYYDLLPNDNLRSYGFFRPTGGMNLVDYDSQDSTLVGSQEVSIIFWFNMDRIDKALSDKFRFNELLKADIINALNNNDIVTEIRAIFDDTDQIFQGYSITDVTRQYLRHPYGGCRVDCTLNFRSDILCEDNLLVELNGRIQLEQKGQLIDPLTGLPIP